MPPRGEWLVEFGTLLKRLYLINICLILLWKLLYPKVRSCIMIQSKQSSREEDWSNCFEMKWSINSLLTSNGVNSILLDCFKLQTSLSRYCFNRMLKSRQELTDKLFLAHANAIIRGPLPFISRQYMYVGRCRDHHGVGGWLATIWWNMYA